MNRVFAGSWVAHAADRGDRAHQLEAAVGEPGDVASVDLGPLALVFSGPPPSAPGRLWCLLDGHVYNLPEVVATADVPPDAPVETALALAFERLGEAMLRRLRGDFVLVLWNRLEHRGWVVRDQLGGRAAYLACVGDRLLFASEVRHLLRLLPRRPSPDRAALAHWLNLSGPPGDRTMFEGVRRLEAAHVLELSAPTHRMRCYWTPSYERPLSGTREELVGELRTAVSRAVECRLPPGEPAGVLLSGGLDSGTVASVATRLVAPERRPVAAYSATFPGHPSIDESGLIDRLTGELGLPGVRMVVRDGSVLSGALDYLRAWELPPPSPNVFFWAPLLERAHRDGVSVMLDGEGGDEMFGLAPYLLADRVRRGRLISALRLARRVPFYGATPPWRTAWWLTRLYGVSGSTPLALQRLRRRFRDPAHYAQPYLSPQMAMAHLETDDTWNWKARGGPRWWAALADSVIGNGPMLAFDHIRRRGNMAGIGPRHPLVDVDLLELVLRLPPELAWDRRHSRPLLRESMAGVVPDEIRLRPDKSMFDTLFQGSVTGPDLPAIRQLLGNPAAALREYVDLDVVRAELLGAPPRQAAQLRGWANCCYRLVTAECWLQLGQDAAFADRLVEEQRLPAPGYDLVEAAS